MKYLVLVTVFLAVLLLAARQYPNVGAVTVGLAANRPASCQIQGQIYYATDTGAFSYSTSASACSWVNIAPLTLNAVNRVVFTGYSQSTGVYSTAEQQGCTDPQTGTTYTFNATTDFECTVTATNAAAQTYTLPDAGTGGFVTYWETKLINNSTNDAGVVTVTRQTASTFHIYGQSGTVNSFLVLQGQTAAITSPDNVNWNVSITTTIPHSFAIANLPSASTVPTGTTTLVLDATTFTVGTCTGGGSDTMIAVSNGTAWSCH